MSSIVRYSDEEMTIFKINIEKKLHKAKKDLEFLLEQIQDVADARDGDGDIMDDASNSNDLERLYVMVSRQRHYVRDLENALLRIRNKSYGICVLTGELIDKRRLLAVPVTTKSLAAKNAVLTEQPKKEDKKTVVVKKNKPPVVISKVIRGKKIQANPPYNLEENDLLFDDELFDESILNRVGYDNPIEDSLSLDYMDEEE